jgi:hypothetical protein
MSRALLLTFFALTSGCAAPVASTLLRWSPLPPAGRSDGKVVLAEIVNRRPADRGGQDMNVIGNVRSTSGAATPVRVDDPKITSQPMGLDESVRRFVGDGLSAGGVGLVPADDPSATAVLAVEIRDFYADGYSTYAGRVALDVLVLDPKTRGERKRFRVQADGQSGKSSNNCEVWEKANASSAYTQFCFLFDKALNTAGQQLVTELGRPDVRAAILNVFSMPGAPNAGSGGGGGCSKDTDCKGDRICDRGSCVDPRPRGN